MTTTHTTEAVLAQLNELGLDGKVPVEALRELSNKHKPGNDEYDDVTGKLEALASDGPAARQLVTKYLHETKLGYELTRTKPIMASGILAWLIDRVANLLDAPPSYRWRAESGDFEDDDAPPRRAATEAADEMGLADALRKWLRRAVTSGQAYLRVYPTDDGIKPRVFGASGILRIPHPALADEIEHDQVFGLPLSGGMLEVHWVDAQGERRMVWCDAETGAIAPTSPFLTTEHRTGYELLPAVRLASEPTVGDPYVEPRASRVNFTLSISGLLNDLHAMGALEAHAILIWLTSETSQQQQLGGDAKAQPPKIAPGSGWKTPPGDDVKYLTAQPLIDQVLSIVLQLMQTWMLGEHVPQHEAKGDAVRTGQALLVSERGLQARSEAMRPGLVRGAADVWKVAQEVGQELPELDLVLQLAPQRVPATLREILDDLSKSLALDLSSRPEAIMRLHGCSRDEAIARLEQLDADLERWGKGAAKDEANTTGGGFTENLEASDGGTVDSVADANRDRSAADARADRREGEAA